MSYLRIAREQLLGQTNSSHEFEFQTCSVALKTMIRGCFTMLLFLTLPFFSKGFISIRKVDVASAVFRFASDNPFLPENIGSNFASEVR
jgi:hypothetical protein